MKSSSGKSQLSDTFSNACDRRDFFKILTASAVTSALTGSQHAKASSGKKEKTSRPNIILIMVDELGARDLGCYGNMKYKTPHIDELARTGVSFQTCWATPLCSPSRAEIMTGRYGFRNGVYHNMYKTTKNVAQDNLVFSRLLKDTGYATAHCGNRMEMAALKPTDKWAFDETLHWPRRLEEALKNQYLADGGKMSPDRYKYVSAFWHPGLLHNGELVKTTDEDYAPDLYVKFIDDFTRRCQQKDQPFFVYYPMCLIHPWWDFDIDKHTYVATPKLDENGNRVPGKTLGNKKSNVEITDYLVGQIVKNLEKAQLRENTIIFFAGDNGGGEWGKWFPVEERGVRVPMIVNCPDVIKPTAPRSELVDFSDILPTFAELAGADLPENYVIDGHSFAPLLRGEPFTPREWIFSYCNEQRQLRDQRWLLDGYNHFYDCGSCRDETDYRDVTDSTDPQVIAARKRFERILQNLPAPDTSDPYFQKRKKDIEKIRLKKKLYKQFQEQGKF